MTEFGFIDKIASMCRSLPDNGWEGIGDDCAVLLSGDRATVVSCDMLVEGVHFLRHAAPAHIIGRKALAVNLSDIAAMGARPTAALLSIALTDDAAGAWAEEFMAGFTQMASEHGTALIGGDTTASKQGVSISVTVIGTAPAANIKRRSDARAGDIVAVTGMLGESGAGLQQILSGRCDTPAAHAHMNPAPHTAEGEWLGSRREVHAMMDISDGIASDLRHIMERSGVGADIDTEHVPAFDDLRTALCAGEDYKLLLTARADGFGLLAADFEARFRRPLYKIGRITAQAGLLRWLRGGTPEDVDFRGFVHF